MDQTSICVILRETPPLIDFAKQEQHSVSVTSSRSGRCYENRGPIEKFTFHGITRELFDRFFSPFCQFHRNILRRFSIKIENFHLPFPKIQQYEVQILKVEFGLRQIPLDLPKPQTSYLTFFRKIQHAHCTQVFKNSSKPQLLIVVSVSLLP